MTRYSRRHFLKSSLLSTLAISALPSRAQPGDAPKPPNILFILVDDQSPFTLNAYGNPACHTPNLDRLAAEGMTLDAAYHMGSWSGAVCLPSRTMIMTGRTLWHIPGKGNPHQDNPALVPPDIPQNTLPAIFNRAGYDTFRTCKQGNSYKAANALFNTAKDRTCRMGNDQEGSWWHAEQAVDYLQDYAKRPKKDPFLLFLGFSHPHDPRNGKPDLLKKYAAVNEIPPDAKGNPQAPPLPANYLPKHPFHHGHPGLRDEERVQGVMTSRAPAVIRNETGREYACIENIDAQLGRVLRQLEAIGERDNTYILYTADHGIAVGRHGLMGKQNLYEHTWRVPFIVRGPGIAPGSRQPGNIYLLDILPTLCDWAGITPPESLEGKSFRPVLEGKKDVVRDCLYGAYCGGTKPGMRAIRKGDWKLIKYDVLEGKVRQTQLFNLKENPHEFLDEHHAPEVTALTGAPPAQAQRNRADDPACAQIRKELEARLKQEQHRLNDPYPLWDQ